MVSIDQITKELRIPDLKYEISNSQETEEIVVALSDFLSDCARDASLLDGETSLIKVLEIQGDRFRLSPRIYNSLFLCDRLTDVFFRKANIDEQLKGIISGWRFVLAKIFVMYPSLLASESSPILALIDDICASQIGWAQEPKRVSQTVIDRLSEIHESLLTINSISPEPLEALRDNWAKAQEKQRVRIAKLFERLEVTEQGAATSRYSTEFSCYTLGKRLKGKHIPPVINAFLVEKWQPVLRSALLKNGQGDPETEAKWKELVALTERVIFVFADMNRKNNESLFRHAEGLVDELAAAANLYEIAIPNDEWESIQQLLILVLQNADIERTAATVRESEINFDDEGRPDAQALSEMCGNWFIFKQNEGATRLKFARYFSDSRQILWLNHAGMKSLIMPYEDLKKGMKAGTISVIKGCYLLSQVFNETLRGLSKVAHAQHEAREKAKQKAAAEAEQLRLEKQQAEALIRLKNQEAAKRLKEEKLKAAEKKRLEKEQETLKLIADLSLGAWISVLEGDIKEKYKLVVKINATNKLIFVDKMGLKKFEVKTPAFMKKLIDGEIEILSGGAEFDDTLSRVVGRLRVGK
ncbi:DUF1631 domain-containing protein [Alkalimarinus alittae]|uniref:DUF1631 domain-containing protein n=1 Tax=Alkalimarinus alittae TaxID=2961619 RepID=A0ABY6N774_9ALTE|nr:DUF1631 domain-containing protein [Alkalimarinus alittae]UZE97870.1 DUF1631 domain-containing protein [Alkalimarinus alittae]